MTTHRLGFILVAAILFIILLSSSLFTVEQTQQALVLRFGEVVREIKQPGLNVKMPFIEDVEYFDNRILNLDPPAATLTLADQKRLVIDAFARWRITDPLAFYKALRTEGQAEARLGNLINGALLDVMGKVPLEALLTAKRDTVMQDVRDRVNADVQRLGMTIVDIRIGRADLPQETLEAVFQRMASERQREAEQFRAEGQQKSQEISRHRRGRTHRGGLDRREGRAGNARQGRRRGDPHLCGRRQGRPGFLQLLPHAGSLPECLVGRSGHAGVIAKRRVFPDVQGWGKGGQEVGSFTKAKRALHPDAGPNTRGRWRNRVGFPLFPHPEADRNGRSAGRVFLQDKYIGRSGGDVAPLILAWL